MNTQIIKMNKDRMDWVTIAKAGQTIREGGLVAFPTETVYGLGGDAMNAESSRKIYEAKGRPSDNPLIVHIARMEDLIHIARKIPEAAYRLADQFWPGPLTMIFEKSRRVPYQTTGGLETVAVRMPSNRIASALIGAAGGFVAAPSANRSGRPSPTEAKYVIEDLNGKVDMILDGGESVIGLESTIIDLTVKRPTILRPGYITEEMLRRAIGAVEVDKTILEADTTQRPKAPGMKYRHYAPKGNLTIVEGRQEAVTEYINGCLKEQKAAGKKTGVIATDETMGRYQADIVRSAGKRGDEEAIARHLFSILRTFDDEEVEVMYAEAFENKGIGQAIMNRLLKAAGHQIVRV